MLLRNTLRLAVAGLALAGAATVHAQATRTWVSGVGDDVNPCSRTAPCKTFAGAISKTAAGGEIDTLDPGGFGAVTITKSMTIDGFAGGGILSAGVSGVVVNGAGINVVLRNLSINGAGTGIHGINAVAFGSLVLENVMISGVTGSGVHVNATATGAVEIRNTRVQKPCAIGYRSATTVGAVNAILNNVSIDGCTTGIDALAGSKVVVRDSSITHATMGVGASAGASVTLDRSTVAYATSGVVGHGGATAIRVGGSTVAENGTGLSALAGAQLFSFGNNILRANTVDGAFTSTLGLQ